MAAASDVATHESLLNLELAVQIRESNPSEARRRTPSRTSPIRADVLSGDFGGIEGKIEYGQVKQLIGRHILKLDEAQRVIVIAVYYLGYSIEQISRETDRPYARVQADLEKARRFLKREMSSDPSLREYIAGRTMLNY